jgi:MYXO-CTERM domain-containing protein
MSRTPSLPRSVALLVAVLAAAIALVLAPLSALPSAGVTEDGATQTAEPAADSAVSTAEPGAGDGEAVVPDEPAVAEEAPVADDPAVTEAPGNVVMAVPPAEDFEVYSSGGECGFYGAEVFYDGDASTLRLALQEEVEGSWDTVSMSTFSDVFAFVGYGVEEGETVNLRIVVYDVAAPEELTVLDGPVTVTGVSEEECEGPPEPTLPEDQWTLAEAACGSVAFSSRADQNVAVLWWGMDDVEGEPTYFFLEPGQSRTFETTEELIFWASAAGIDENFEPIEGEFALAGEGELEIPQDCTAPPKPGGGHQIPGKVQTDGGASTAPMALGLALMGLAGAALVRRRA